MIFYLVRHTSVDVPPFAIYGQTDVNTRESFPQEAQVVKENLEKIAAKHGLTRFNRVYVSPLSRCRKLANYCGYTDARIEKRIMEINFGDWEMTTFETNKDPLLQEWLKDYINVVSPNGESYRMQYERVSAFLMEAKEKWEAVSDEPVLIFAHGGVLVSAAVFAKNIPVPTSFDQLPAYGEIIKIEI